MEAIAEEGSFGSAQENYRVDSIYYESDPFCKLSIIATEWVIDRHAAVIPRDQGLGISL
jgi:hypothetical protein